MFADYRVRLGRIAREIWMDLEDESLTEDEYEALDDMYFKIKAWMERTKQ